MKEEQGKLFIVSGPSGVGKTTVVTEFLRQFGQLFEMRRVVTYTTKVPRLNEVHGLDYFFISQHEFDQKIEEGFFLEWSGEYGACYGTPADVLEVVAQGFPSVLVIDRFGAEQILRKCPEAVLVWVQVSSMDVLSERLKSRRMDSAEQIQTRLILAKKEIEQEMRLSMYHHYIDNNDLKVAVKAMFDIVSLKSFSVQNDIK